MSLKSKLFMFTVFIITTSLLFFGLLYFNDIDDIFNKQTKQNIQHDNKMINLFVSDIKKNIKNIANEIRQHEEIKSSLSLISSYGIPNNYETVMFNFESDSVLKTSKNWIHFNSNYNISFYDKNKNLVSIHRQQQDTKDIGFIAYDENEKLYFSNSIDPKNKNIPLFDTIDTTLLDNFSSSYKNNTYSLNLIYPLTTNKTIVGYSKVSYSFDNRALKKIQKYLLNNIFLMSNDNYILPEDITKNELKKFNNPRDFILNKTKLFDDKISLYTVNIIDKRDIHKKLNELVADIFLMWTLILIGTLVISFSVTNRYILEPIKNLQNGIKNIKENKFVNIKVLDSDEIGIITKEFNTLSKKLGNNISFLESYKSAMDKGNIVTKSDLNGNITYVNQNFVDTSGYSKEEALGQSHSMINDPETPKEVFQTLWETIRANKTWRGILKNIKKDGSFYWVDIVIEPILNKEGQIVEYIAIRHDITELVLQRERLNKIANQDLLTGLGNRFKLKNDIQRLKNPYIGILNIDKFRQTNDFYGHKFGDELIKEVASILEKLTKKENTFMLYHLQADEFVILSYTQNKIGFFDTINSIVHTLEHNNLSIQNEQISLKFTSSISYETSDKVLQTADMALQIAKRQNIDIYVYKEDESLYKEYENNIKWTKKLKLAIEANRIVPFFQPIVNNTNQKYEKYESLVRMIDEDGKVISPFFFLDIAKQTKYYNNITKIMIEKSFEQFKDKDCEFSINLTIDDILNKEIQIFISDMLEKSKIGNKVVFEIVESESIENFKDVLDFISNVKTYGCKIAIDDFGTGYSNFEYLMKLKADYIKIDGSMIKDIDTNNDARMVVSTIVDFAKKMNMKTIAEYVENESILNVVLELGIDYTQGYFYSEPKQEI